MTRTNNRCNCPSCRHPASRVVTTFNLSDGRIVRRRRCPECDHRWYTQQEPEFIIKPESLHWSRPTKAPRSTIVDSDVFDMVAPSLKQQALELFSRPSRPASYDGPAYSLTEHQAKIVCRALEALSDD